MWESRGNDSVGACSPVTHLLQLIKTISSFSFFFSSSTCESSKKIDVDETAVESLLIDTLANPV